MTPTHGTCWQSLDDAGIPDPRGIIIDTRPGMADLEFVGTPGQFIEFISYVSGITGTVTASGDVQVRTGADTWTYVSVQE